MGHYLRYQRKPREKKEPNPIWRGIGCLTIVIFLILAYWITTTFNTQLIATGKIPSGFLGYVHFPAWVFKLRFLSVIATFIGSINNFWLINIMFFMILLILFVVTTFIGVLIYNLLGPARYTDLDAPPTKRRAKVYKR
jgi:hypothetical protein